MVLVVVFDFVHMFVPVEFDGGPATNQVSSLVVIIGVVVAVMVVVV